jgi:hypothetical protein
MKVVQGASCAFLLSVFFIVFPAKSCDFTLTNQDFGGFSKARVTYTFMDDSTKEIRSFLAKPEIKDLCALFQPTLRIEDSGRKIFIEATQGSYDVARQVFGRFSILPNAPFTQLLGIKEQPLVPLDQLVPRGFNAQVYMLLNPDLSAYLPENQDRNFAALSHYLNYGRLEKRGFMPKEFNPDSYLACNPDVNDIAMQQKDPSAFAALHRYVWAPQENRPYLPADFEEEVYLKLHPDVNTQAQKTANPLEVARQHYLRDGRNENRIYKVTLPEDFSWMAYIELNNDVLNEVAKTTSLPKHAMWHYTHHGFFEGRSYKK